MVPGLCHDLTEVGGEEQEQKGAFLWAGNEQLPHCGLCSITPLDKTPRSAAFPEGVGCPQLREVQPSGVSGAGSGAISISWFVLLFLSTFTLKSSVYFIVCSSGSFPCFQFPCGRALRTSTAEAAVETFL